MERAQRAFLEQHQPVTPSIRQSIKKEVFGSLNNPSPQFEDTVNSRRVNGRTVQFLRSLQFGFIREKFAQGGFWGKKTTVALFMFPIMASMCLGATQMVQSSFLVYLKYQALVDAYYYKELAAADAAKESSSQVSASDLIEQAKQTAQAPSAASASQ